MRGKTVEQFIKDAISIWGNRYDYSNVVYTNSRKKVVIRCIEHNVLFEQTPFCHIIMKREGCPKCQEIRKNRKNSKKHKKLLPIAKYDDYIKDWDYENNKDYNPNTLTAGSAHKVWWKCSVCGHSWQASPSRRRLQGFNCPICSLKNVNTERIKKKGSFAENCPERAKDWDYEKNGELLHIMKYFTNSTLNHLRLQQGLSARHRQRSHDVTLACKLTLVYGKYHLMMDYRQLAMIKHQMTYQEAERQAEMMNQITIVHHSAADFLDTPDERVNDSIDTYREYKRLLEEYSDEVFVPAVVEEFCKRVYEDDEHFIFFKPFCNLYFSVYADALLWYQQGKIGYEEFCMQFQELSWMDGSRTPLDGKRLKMYIMSMREVVEAYHRIKAEKI